MTAREAFEGIAQVARANGVWIAPESAWPILIARLDARAQHDPTLIARFYEAGLQMAQGHSIMVDFYV